MCRQTNAVRIPNDYGLNLASNTKTFVACTTIVPNCVSCLKSDATVCLACDQKNVFYLYTNPNTLKTSCMTVAALPLGYGANIQSGKAEKCPVECLACGSNINSCLKCDQANGFFRNVLESKCYHRSTFISGQGPNLNMGTIQVCMVQYCVDCASDSKFCQKCDDVHAIDPSKTICYIRPELKVRSTQYLSVSNKAIILFQEKIMNKNYIDLLDIKIVDDKGNPYTDYASLTVTIMDTKDGITIAIDF